MTENFSIDLSLDLNGTGREYYHGGRSKILFKRFNPGRQETPQCFFETPLLSIQTDDNRQIFHYTLLALIHI